MKEYNVHGKTIYFMDECGDPWEILGDNYKIFDKGLTFQPDDVIIDVGANVGYFSIMMAKIFPFTKIYAFDPMPLNIFRLQKHIEINNVGNIQCFELAVGAHDGEIEIIYDDIDLGGSSSYVTFQPFLNKIMVKTITLDTIFETHEIKKCRLLKIDCEGAEYDILYNTKTLDKIENVVGEFHLNNRLRAEGHDWYKLADYVNTKSNMMYFEWCDMAQ